MLRDLGKRQRAGRIDDDSALIVDLGPGKRCDRRAGGDHDVRGGDDLARDLDRIGTIEGRIAFKPIDLVFLEQIFDPAGQFADGLGFFSLHLIEVERDPREVDPELGEAARLCLGVKLRRVKQRLGRNAADVEARAPKRLAALGAGGLEPQLRRADRGDIATRAGADDDEVVVVSVCHAHSLMCSSAGRSLGLRRCRHTSRATPDFAPRSGAISMLASTFSCDTRRLGLLGDRQNIRTKQVWCSSFPSNDPR